MSADLATDAGLLFNLGYLPRPVRPNEKRPALCCDWRTPRSLSQTLDDFKQHAAEGARIGLVTGSPLVVIDFDRKAGVDGAEEWKRAGLPDLPTNAPRALTPSGGSHVYLRAPHAIEVGNSVAHLAAGVDVRGVNGFVVIPPSPGYTWDENRPALFDVPAADLPELPWEVVARAQDLHVQHPAPAIAGPERIWGPGDREHAKERARRYLETVEPAVSGQGGHDATFRAACRAAELCLFEPDLMEVMREWNARCSPPWSVPELQHKTHDAVETVGLGGRFERPAAGQPPELPVPPDCIAYVQPAARYVGLVEDGSAWDLTHTFDQAAARRVLIANGYEPKKASALLNEHKVIHAHAVDTVPGERRTFPREGRTILNAWTQPDIQPAPGGCPVLREAVSFVAGSPEGEWWLLQWLARCLQFPERRFRTAPILSGQQRTGKSVLIRAVRNLIGQNNSATVRTEDILSQFNASFATRLLVAVNEIETEHLNSATGKLRFLTGEDRLPVEGKHAATRECKNRIKLIGSSNSRFPVRVDSGDTRWSLLRQDRAAPGDYLARLETLFQGAEWSAKGRAEVAAFGHFLLNMKTDPDVENVPYHDGHHEDAVGSSVSAVHAFADEIDSRTVDGVWATYVNKGDRSSPELEGMSVPGFPDCIDTAALYALFRPFAAKNGYPPVRAARFNIDLRSERPGWTYYGQTTGAGGRKRDTRRGAARLSMWEGLPRDHSLRAPPEIGSLPELTPGPAPAFAPGMALA